ncbi:MAG: PTS sugar transporter subunit IIC, partial [Myxococcales bacterium]
MFPPGGLVHLFVSGLVAALVTGLAAVERKGALQLMLSRPLVLGPILGWALGDALGGVTIGIPLELLFLGGVNLGGSLPENETLLAGAVTTAAVLAGEAAGTGVDPPLAALALALLFPLALVGRRLESRTEQRNNAFFQLAFETVE